MKGASIYVVAIRNFDVHIPFHSTEVSLNGSS